MDIARPDLKRRKNRTRLTVIGGCAAAAAQSNSRHGSGTCSARTVRPRGSRLLSGESIIHAPRTIAAARLILPPDVHLQTPPNLTDDFGVLLEAGIDDWGGVSPVTADHVNPERPWPALDRLREVTEARGFANSTRHGELVVRLKGPYDIAASRPEAAPENAPYELSTDWWNGHVEAEVGPNYGRLLQLYGVHKTMREASRKRLRATRHQETDGSIRITLALSSEGQ